jgi:hypothetical protein
VAGRPRLNIGDLIVLPVAWTLADLAGRDVLDAGDVRVALDCRGVARWAARVAPVRSKSAGRPQSANGCQLFAAGSPQVRGSRL